MVSGRGSQCPPTCSSKLSPSFVMADITESETSRDYETESKSQNASALAEDNKRLQDMLHSALRREAEALRRVKHLSELLSECRITNSRTSSSDPEQPESATVSPSLAEGSWGGRGDWRTRPVWETRTGWEMGDSEHGSAPLSQSSEPPQSPSLVVSPPLVTTEDSTDKPPSPSPAFPLIMSAPSALGPLHGDRSSPDFVLENNKAEDYMQSSPTCDDQLMSLPGLLAPALHTSGDIRKERERPPPSQPQHSSTMDTTRKLSEEGTAAAYKHATTGRIDRRSSVQPTPVSADLPNARSRTNSLLRPSWLRKRAYSLAGKKKPQSSSSHPTSIPAMFSHFLQHSSHITSHSLAQYIDKPWSEVCHGGQCSPDVAKYCHAVWELFQSETKYLCNQLQPLEQVYKAFLEELQFYGFLAVADVQKIFANLSELVELSVSVATDLFQLFAGRRGEMIAATNELILAFSMFGHKWNPVYQRFCVNIERQRGFVKALQQLPDFQEYIVACRGHPMVQRSDLTDFLIAPLQHQCHYQLLLENVLKATSNPTEKSLLTSAIKAFAVALNELQANITAHQMSVELLELQETLSWPSLASLCPDSYIPEGLSLEQQPCQDQLAISSRQLLDSGLLRLIDNRGRPCIELHGFLFTDMILFAEPHSKQNRRDRHRVLTRYTVYRQPMFLRWLEIYALPSPKYCFTVVCRNSLHQLVASHTLQASSAEDRDKWVSSIIQTQQNYCHHVK